MFIDIRPAVRLRLIRAVKRAENCVSLNNPGCLKGKRGYARFATIEDGERALEAWFDRKGCLPIREALKRYNPINPVYADVILKMADVPGDVAIGSCE
jgi:hypothetical protein